MGDHGPRQGDGKNSRANLAASGNSIKEQPPLTPVPDPESPLWAAIGPAESLQFFVPAEGPDATFEIADFNRDTDQVAVLADTAVTRLAAVTTLSPPNAATTHLRLEFLWTDLPQDPGYHLTVFVAGQHCFTLDDVCLIAPLTKTAEWILQRPTDAETVTIAAAGFEGPLHLIEVSQIYDQVGTSANGRFVEHSSRFYVFATAQLGPADILAPFAGEDWRLLAQLPGVAKVFEITLMPRNIGPETDQPRDYPVFITDRDLASNQSLNYHY